MSSPIFRATVHDAGEISIRVPSGTCANLGDDADNKLADGDTVSDKKKPSRGSDDRLISRVNHSYSAVDGRAYLDRLFSSPTSTSLKPWGVFLTKKVTNLMFMRSMYILHTSIIWKGKASKNSFATIIV